MAETPTKTKRVLHCTLCRRVLTGALPSKACRGPMGCLPSSSAQIAVVLHLNLRLECNNEPCPGKEQRKKQNSALSASGDKLKTSSESLEDSTSRKPSRGVGSEEQEEISAMLSTLIYNDQTCEPQAYLIGQLENLVGLRGSSQWCCVRGMLFSGYHRRLSYQSVQDMISLE